MKTTVAYQAGLPTLC